jgi:hypothetical protein
MPINFIFDISDKIAATITRLKESQKVSVEEKLIDGKLSLEFFAERINLVINSNVISVSAQDDYILTRSFLQKDEIINMITSSSDSKAKANSRFSKLKSWIVHNKWLFIITSPFIMKVFELIEYMIKYSQPAPGEDV